MHPNDYTQLRHARRHHQRLLAEAEERRSARLAQGGSGAGGFRAATAAFLRALAARVEPRGRRRLA